MTRDELRAIIIEEIGNIAPEADAAGLGDGEDLREALDLDSMDIFNLVIALSRRLGIDIADADAGRLAMLGSGVDYLEARLAETGR